MNEKLRLLSPLICSVLCAIWQTQVTVIAHEDGQHSTNSDTIQNQAKRGHSAGYHRKFDNAKHWVKVFDDPERDRWQLPNRVIDSLEIKPDDVVADIGAGTGYFSFRIAKAEPKAKVYAADVERDMLDFLAAESKRQNCSNVIPFEIKTSNPELPEKASLVLIVDTFHHIDNRTQYFKDLKRSLASDCRVVIIDFTDKSPVGPPKEHRIERTEVIAELEDAGFTLKREQHFLPNQYFLEFALPDRSSRK